jgi:histidinol-phosphate aminotransferase
MRHPEFFSGLVPDNIATLAPYQPGKPVEELERELGITGAIKIASNENPMGPSPLAVEAATRAVREAHLYPDGAAHHLRAALAERNAVRPEQLVFGAGSNELIYLVVGTFCKPGHDQLVTHQYAFISYRLAARAHDVDFVAAEVTGDLRCDVDALIAAFTPRTKLVILANPNNPTGAHLRRGELERLLAALPARALLVVDEAYHEYAAAVADADEYPHSQRYQTEDEPRIITLRTFSKIYGLAGLRVGYGIGHPAVIDFINRLRRPFNVNSVAQAAALAALSDDDHVARSQQAAAGGIDELSRAVAELGLRAYPSLCNFVLVDVGRPAAPVYDALLGHGVIVRPMGAWGLDGHIRISVGTPEQTRRVTQALRDVLG